MSLSWSSGKYAIVGLDLTRTYSNCGEDCRMEDMKGKRWKIKHVSDNGNTIQLYYEGREYFYFSRCDLRLADDDVKIKYPKPVKFNTAHLDI